MSGKITELDGITYKSSYEAEAARLFKENNIRFTYEERKLPYIPKPAYYKIDFTVYPHKDSDEDAIIVETKGYFDQVSRAKMEQIFQQYPNLDIRMVFQNPNVLIKPSTTYAYKDWCEKRKVPHNTLEEIVAEVKKKRKARERANKKSNAKK